MKEKSVGKRVGKRIVWIAGWGLMAAGFLLLLGPDVKTWYFRYKTIQMLEDWEEEWETEENRTVEESIKESEEPESPEGIIDCEIHEKEGTADPELTGYIRIPAMDVTLPLYMNATTEHLSKGAAVIAGTSPPVGGKNTNCVIAGHRGYSGMPYFRDIENLQTGDYVYITNAKKTLTYRVESIKIICPDDTGAIGIQEGKDMVTLLTCHPYRSHGKQRYLVYCIRDTGAEASAETYTEDEKEEDGKKYSPEGNVSAEYTADTEEPEETISSIPDICFEKWLHRAAVFLTILLFWKLLHRHREGTE